MSLAQLSDVVWLLIATGWTLACGWLAWRYPAGVLAAGGSDWQQQLSDRLACARDDSQRLVEVNEALDDVEHALDTHATMPRAAAWLILTGCALTIVIGVVVTASTMPLWCATIAVAGLLFCSAAARTGKARAQRRRADVDDAVKELTGNLYDELVAIPTRRRMRWRKS